VAPASIARSTSALIPSRTARVATLSPKLIRRAWMRAPLSSLGGRVIVAWSCVVVIVGRGRMVERPGGTGQAVLDQPCGRLLGGGGAGDGHPGLGGGPVEQAAQLVGAGSPAVAVDEQGCGVGGALVGPIQQQRADQAAGVGGDGEPLASEVDRCPVRAEIADVEAEQVGRGGAGGQRERGAGGQPRQGLPHRLAVAAVNLGEADQARNRARLRRSDDDRRQLIQRRDRRDRRRRWPTPRMSATPQ
jgi:hypothetical protein